MSIPHWSNEGLEWIASEWAFSNRSHRSISDEIGLTDKITTLIKEFIVRKRPDLLIKSRWGREVHPYIEAQGEARKALVREILGEPRLKPNIEPLRKKNFSEKYPALSAQNRRHMLNRPLDMGGPRDQWLTFELGDGKP